MTTISDLGPVPPTYLFDKEQFHLALSGSHPENWPHSELVADYAGCLIDRNLPALVSAELVAVWLGWTVDFIRSASNCPDLFYRVYTVPKRSGGLREIAEPLPALKSIQRQILSEILQKCDYSPAAHAYVAGSNVRKNARLHLRQARILKIDAKDFFPSIGNKQVFDIFTYIGFQSEVASILTGLCLLQGGLPQGAPTSAALSNLYMKDFDRVVLEWARSRNLRYTRYADDITVSGDVIGKEEIRYIYNELRNNKLQPNTKKTRILGPGSAKFVTGVLVNERLRGSRHARLRIRQECYYIGRYGLAGHARRLGEQPQKLILRLYGQASYLCWLDPKDKTLKACLEMISEIRASFRDVRGTSWSKPEISASLSVLNDSEPPTAPS